MWENLSISTEKADDLEGTERDDSGKEAENPIGDEDDRVGDSRNRPVRMPVLRRDFPIASRNRAVPVAHRGSGNPRRRPHPVRNHQGEARRLILPAIDTTAGFRYDTHIRSRWAAERSWVREYE